MSTTQSTWWGGNNYSTEEQIIGTWIDGKPLYQKTVNCGALPNKTTKSVLHGISNLGIIVSAYGTAIATNGTIFNMPYVSDNSINTQIALVFTSTDIAIHSAGADRSSFTQSYVTIQYTKTTD